MPFDIHQAVTDRIDEALRKAKEEGTPIPWRKPWHTELGMHRNLQSNRPYRGINQLLLSMSEYDQPLWSTKKGIHALGGRVTDEEFAKPHQGSTLVTLWKRYRRRPVEGEVPGPDGKVAAFMLRFYTVWNVQQTEGLEKHWLEPKVIVNPERWLDERVAHAECLVDYEYPAPRPKFVHGGNRAFYAPRTDVVKLPNQADFDSPASYVATMFHEFAHSTGHTDRLARFKPSEQLAFGDVDYSAEELVAEFCASMLCAHVDLWGVKEVEQSAAYIDNWRRVISEDKKVLVLAAARAQKAADYIVGKVWDNDEVAPIKEAAEA